MTDDELTRRLAETLRRKAAQVPEPRGEFLPNTELRVPIRRRARRWGLLAAAAIIIVAGITAAVISVREGDEPDHTAAPVATSTTTTTTTTTLRGGGYQSFVWTGVVTRPDGTVLVDEFNKLLDMSPPWGDDPVKIAEKFTRLDPTNPSPHETATIDDATTAGDGSHVVIRASLADDSVAFIRYDVRVRRAADARCGSGRVSPVRVWSR